MNAPNRYELFVVEEGEKPIEITEDTKIPNAATIKVTKQDHTLANMLRAQLLNMPQVLFAGYKVPHPLHPYFIIKLQTDGTINPQDALIQACSQLVLTLADLKRQFVREFQYKDVEPSGASEDVYGVSGVGGPWAAGGRDYLDF